MSERQIVVVGAGIGGLTAALSLARAGFHAIICERAEALSEIGAGIQLSPNAAHVLRELRLEEAIGQAAAEPEAIEVRSGTSGRLVVVMPGELFRRRYGAPYRVIHRARFQAALVEEVARHPDIELVLGAKIVDIKSDAAGASVAIEEAGGRSGFRATALIGADGAWSAIRAQIRGARIPEHTGRTAWRALVPAAALSLDPNRIGLWLGRDAHLVHYPAGAGGAINLVAIVEEDWAEEEWSAPGDRNWLLARFNGWASEAREIVAAADEWRKFTIVSVDPAGPWVAERIALLGDAAHAMEPFLAQGAAMAIEDAAVLARALAARPDNVPTALRAYEGFRKERVRRVASASRQTGAAYHFGPPLDFARDSILNLVGPSLLLARNDWIYRWRPGDGAGVSASASGRPGGS